MFRIRLADEPGAGHTNLGLELIQTDGRTELRVVTCAGGLLTCLEIGQHLQHCKPGKHGQCRGHHHFDQRKATLLFHQLFTASVAMVL